MTEQSEHLSNAQIENYGIRTSGAGPDAAKGDEHKRVANQPMAGQRVDDQSTADQSISDQRVEAHLADCTSCRNRLLEFHRNLFAPTADSPEAAPSKNDVSPRGDSPTDQKWVDLKDEGVRPTDSARADSKFANSKYPVQAQVRTAPTPECPSDDALRQLAAGLSVDDSGAALTQESAAATSDAFTTRLLQHAATCDHCGPLLQAFTEDFSDDFAPEEQASLATLRSASAEWQKNTARHMLQAAGRSADVSNAATASTTEAGSPRTAATVRSDRSDEKSTAGRPVSSALGRKPFFWKWALVPAAAAALAAITFTIYYAQRVTPEKVEVLLAQAYTENRNMEMRIPYAKHADFKQTLSGESPSLLSSPDALRKATNEIAAQLKKNPDNPSWLMLSARLDLLDWRYKSALSTLSKIDTDRMDGSRQFRMTQSLALYEKAEIEHDPQAYGEIVDLMGKTLQENADDTIALFNQAIACERIQLYECAASDYGRVMKIESDMGWSGEARKHLSDIEEKKKAEH